MLIIHPVVARNAPVMVPLGLLYEKLGPNKAHHLIVSADPGALVEAQAFAKQVEKLFASVELVVVPAGDGSINSRNSQFRHVINHVVNGGNKEPIIWMEDACPTKPGWIDVVADEWAHKPVDRFFLGCIEPNYDRAVKDGKVIMEPKPLFQRRGDFMRFGVYPHDLLERCPLLRSADSVSFERHIRNEVVFHCQPSRTMGTLWASRHFESKSGYVVGEPTPGVESEIRKHGANSANPDALAIIHGCRDGSLEFVMSRRKHEPLRTTRIEPVAAGIAIDQSAEVERLRRENEELKSMLAGKPEETNETTLLDGESVSTEAKVIEPPVVSTQGVVFDPEQTGSTEIKVEGDSVGSTEVKVTTPPAEAPPAEAPPAEAPPAEAPPAEAPPAEKVPRKGKVIKMTRKPRKPRKGNAPAKKSPVKRVEKKAK